MRNVIQLLLTAVLFFAVFVACDRLTQSPESEEKETATLTTEEAIIKKLGKQNNLKQDRIVYYDEFDNQETEASDDIVKHITLSTDDNASLGLVKSGMYIDSADVFKIAFDDPKTSEVVLIWEFPLLDEYGNENIEKVMNITLDRETFEQINFETFDPDNYSSVAKNYSVLPAFE
ncbi:hypothetical protein BTO30_16715 [Domibacillus antri]|uniref:Lipoprotein n=1 Tax=Domibacillus antri TaxID=1714264 RepID=A0A1Q8Q1A6_9BACI|nr:hypothetical protein [Domibacillus antri]OLN21119.1 hypothetical protein BTO30_16715 [Domibacillus antri]